MKKIRIKVKKIRGRKHLPPPPQIHRDRSKYYRPSQKELAES